MSHVDEAVTYSELHRGFELLGTNTLPVSEGNWYLQGHHLAVTVEHVDEFAAEFRFLTRARLDMFTSTMRWVCLSSTYVSGKTDDTLDVRLQAERLHQ